MEPELAHPKWNAFKAAIKKSNKDTAVMKLTVLCNFNHGSFCSGDRLYQKQELFQRFLNRQDENYFIERAEEVSFDRNEEVDESTARSSLQDFMDCQSIKNRLKFVTQLYLQAIVFGTLLLSVAISYPRFEAQSVSPTTKVKNKAWFGMNAAFRAIVKDWTIQSEAAHALVHETRGGVAWQPLAGYNRPSVVPTLWLDSSVTIFLNLRYGNLLIQRIEITEHKHANEQITDAVKSFDIRAFVKCKPIL